MKYVQKSLIFYLLVTEVHTEDMEPILLFS